jgi:hypothetical protein
MEISDRPFALFITWTCYGTWLPGDKRGHVSNVLLPNSRYERSDQSPNSPYPDGDPRTRTRAAGLQKYTTARLCASDAFILATSLLETSVSHAWFIPRAAILFNHVHVVVCKCPPDGPAVRRLWKGRAHADFRRSSSGPQHLWTKGGSDRYLNDGASIAGAIHYVANQLNPLAEIIDGRILTRVEIDAEARRRKAGGSL